MTGATMVEKAKAWAAGLPGWIPICITLVGGIFYAGGEVQHVKDQILNLQEHVTIVERQIVQIQDYISHHHAKIDGDSSLPQTYVPQ